MTDGFSTYGDRAFLKFSEGPGGYGDGLSNYSVGQRELDVLDQLTSNRDVVVWAAAQGKKIKPIDSNAARRSSPSSRTSRGRSKGASICFSPGRKPSRR